MVKKTRKFDGKLFRKEACYYTESDADNEAERQRRIGYNARVVEVEGKFCVYKRKK